MASATPRTDPALRQDVDATAASVAAGVLLRVTRNGVVTQYRAGAVAPGTDRPVPFDARAGDDPTIPGPHAHGYLIVGDTPVDITELNPSVAGSAGAVISTTADLDRFLTALLGGKLLPPGELARLETIDRFTHAYGLDLQVLRLPCGITVYGHEGGIDGYSDAERALGHAGWVLSER